ncbi:hypothetical protein [Sphingobium yanoikuyae]|uniref:hypothetical protein n=1 Tax=Sphingobium yanoikuyae TaxID=13690 RepID=UPI0028A6673C|nr:hypothetical protein [Sphingobium yanoikuyae]
MSRNNGDWFHLWFQFLRISPSYELARRFRAGELPDKTALPDDFETVLSVYDDLGDVQDNTFIHWWRAVAIRQFGMESGNPALTRLGVISYDDEDDRLMRLRSSVRDYLAEEWLDQVQPTTIIAAIPVGAPKAQIMKQLSAMIDAIASEERSLNRRLLGQNAPYRLARTAKLHRTSTFKYLRCLMTKARLPDAKLWQIGAIVKLSSTYSERLDSMTKPGRHQQTEDRTALKILTSRALHRGHMIAENAARGIFPSYAKCPSASPMDFALIHQQRMERFRKA